MDIVQLPSINAVDIQQISDIQKKAATKFIQNSEETFPQVLRPEDSGVEKLTSDQRSSTTIQNASVEKSLEKMIVGLMMKPLFTEFAEFTFGKGVEADIYASLFSDAMADKIAAGGSLGLDKYMQNIDFETNTKGL